MSELVVISMARLGADKLRTEWKKSQPGLPNRHVTTWHPTGKDGRKTASGGRRISSATLAYGALALAIVLSAILGVATVTHWFAMRADSIPRGEVYVTQLDSDASMQVAPGDTDPTASVD